MNATTYSETISPPGKSMAMLITAIGGLAIAAGFVFYNLITNGHAAFNTNSTGIVWGLPIVAYDYLMLTSTGLAMLASLPLVFGVQSLAPVQRRSLWLALATLIGAVAVLFLELGHPFRALYAVHLNLQTASPLFWKVLLVTVYAPLLFLLLVLMDFNRHRTELPALARPLGLLVVLSALTITLVAGTVYGMMAMRPLWFGGEIPVVFWVESLLGAVAFIVFFSYWASGFRAGRLPTELHRLFAGPLGLGFAGLLGVHLVLHVGRTATGLWSNAEGLQVWPHMVTSLPYHLALWGGIVLPLVLMAVPAWRRQSPAQLLAAILVIVGLLISRYEFVVGGQMVPLFKGNWAPDLLPYAPSATEWVVMLVGIFLALVVFWFGEWRQAQ